MLLFSPPSVALPAMVRSDGQPLLLGTSFFADHLDPKVIWHLPSAVDVMRSQAGELDFFLLRYHDEDAKAKGGLLRFRLGIIPLEAALIQAAAEQGLMFKAAGFSRARFRLFLRSLREDQPDQQGEWHSFVPSSSELAVPTLALNVRETQFLQSMLEHSGPSLEVELDLRYSGLMPGMSWLASANAVKLHSLLHSMLPASPIRADHIAEMFQAIPEDLLDLQALAPILSASTSLVKQQLRTEIALRSLDSLFERLTGEDDFSEPFYKLGPLPADETVEWNLLVPRLEQRSHRLLWTANSFASTLDAEQRSKLFPVVADFSPFSKLTVHVVNRVPYDPHYLRQATVDVRCTGQAGVPEFRSFTFNGTTELQSFSFFSPTVSTDLQLACRFTAILAPPGGIGWPTVRKGDYIAQHELAIEVNRAALGMDFVQAWVEPEAFASAKCIKVALRRAQDTSSSPALAEAMLTASRSSAWVALPGVSPEAELHALVSAEAPDPSIAPITLHSGRLAGRQLRIFAYQLEVLDPERITLMLDPAAEGRFALVQATVAPPVGEEKTFILHAGQPVAWDLFRVNVFAPATYRYRLEYVALDSDGQPLPMASAGWFQTELRNLLVMPPLPASSGRQ